MVDLAFHKRQEVGLQLVKKTTQIADRSKTIPLKFSKDFAVVVSRNIHYSHYIWRNMCL